MLKKIKENQKLQTFLELWQVPRYKALIKLGLYVIFFIFVIVLIRSPKAHITNKPLDKIDVLEKFETMDNYGYNLSFENKTLEAIVYKDTTILTLDDISYYIKDDKVYQKDDLNSIETNIPLEYPLWELRPALIKKLIDKSMVDSKTEYTNGQKATTYIISASDFNDIIDMHLLTDSKFTLYSNSDNIFKVEFDLYLNSLTKNYIQVIFEYNAFGEIDPIIFDLESSE